MVGKRGAAGFFPGLVLVALALLALGGCTSQQSQNTLGFFGLSRKPAVARTVEPPKPPPPAATPAPEEEPVPVAAPRIPVETDGVAPPPGGSPGPRARPRS
jgi:hypothetical protein